MEDQNKFISERKNKIQTWNEFGFDGYAKKFDRTHKSHTAKKFMQENAHTIRDTKSIMEAAKKQARMCGRITNMREMGKLAFLKIQDDCGEFQICVSQKLIGENFKAFLKMLDLGDFCGFEGEFFLTKHGEETLMANEIFPLSKSLRPMPEKWAGVSNKEMCYRERNLDLMSNKNTFERFKLRSNLIKEVRHFFEEKDFMEVETAILQAQAGGAMAKVFETHHNALDHEFVLRIALELDLKRAIGGGFERVFEIGKNFRNEGSDPSHLQEFTMCEWYAAYQDLETNKEWTEELFHRFCANVFKKEQFTVVDTEGNETEINFGGKFTEARFPDLLKEHANLDMFTASDDEVRAKAKEVGVDTIDGVGRANLLDDIYKKTARGKLIQPTFVFDYPEDLKPLARPNGDGTASCFQLVVNGWEIVNSYGELIDPQVQRQLLETQAAARDGGDDEAMPIDEVFLKAMEHGFPPMTGSGFGIDRLIAIFTGQPNLRDVVLFPTMKSQSSTAEKKSNKKETNIAVALINQGANLENWQNLNTIGHLAAAFGARKGENLFFQDEITSKDKKSIKLNISDAIMIKGAPDNQTIKDLITTCQEQDIHLAEFTREMLETTNDKKIIETTKDTDWKNIEHLGILLFGKKSKIEALTKNFQLFK